MAASSVAQWRGRALGADASVALAGMSQIEARPVLAGMEKELDRLERVFSLYRSDSVLVRLNQTGRVDPAPQDLLDVLRLCDVIHEASDGGFDPTIQPLWYASATAGDASLARNLVGWDAVQLTESSIALARPGMALTLNGIAQGYIADRIAGWLAAQGFRDVLVDTGEIVAKGHSGAGRPWQVAIEGPEGQIVKRLTLSGCALATSATHAGTGRAHILDPRGRPVPRQLVSVSAPLAVLADGLSTALCLVPASQAKDLVAQFEGAQIEWLG